MDHCLDRVTSPVPHPHPDWALEWVHCTEYHLQLRGTPKGSFFYKKICSMHMMQLGDREKKGEGRGRWSEGRGQGGRAWGRGLVEGRMSLPSLPGRQRAGEYDMQGAIGRHGCLNMQSTTFASCVQIPFILVAAALITQQVRLVLSTARPFFGQHFAPCSPHCFAKETEPLAVKFGIVRPCLFRVECSDHVCCYSHPSCIHPYNYFYLCRADAGCSVPQHSSQGHPHSHPILPCRIYRWWIHARHSWHRRCMRY